MNEQRYPGPSTAPSQSLIDRESHFTGSYRTPHNLRIDGRYEGDIDCQGTVFVGETAMVAARVIAGNVIIAGQFEGEIAVETRFEVLETGRVAATVSAAVTVVHDGAFYQGELHMFRPGSRPPVRRGEQAHAAPLAGAAPVSRPAPAAQATPPPAPAEPSTAATPPPTASRRRVVEPEKNEPEMPASLIATAAGPRATAPPNGRRTETGSA